MENQQTNIESHLEIKRERLAVRCEVCHQTDCYDAVNNNCLRCCGYWVIEAAQESLAQQQQDQPPAPLPPPPPKKPEAFELYNDFLLILAVAISGMITSCLMLQFRELGGLIIWVFGTTIFSAMFYFISARQRISYALIFHFTLILTTIFCATRFELKLFFPEVVIFLLIIWFLCFCFSMIVFAVCFIIESILLTLKNYLPRKSKALSTHFILSNPKHN